MFTVTVLGIIALAVVVGWVIMRVDGLALFAPKRTKGVWASAQVFCAEQCRTADGRCPLSGTHARPESCPLWKFIRTDAPTSVYGSPFERLPA